MLMDLAMWKMKSYDPAVIKYMLPIVFLTKMQLQKEFWHYEQLEALKNIDHLV